MVERVSVDLTGGTPGLRGAVFRYDVLRRLRVAADRRGVAFLAFGFGERHLRLVLDGPDDEVREVLRGLKVGTVRAAATWGVSMRSGQHHREPALSLHDAVVWTHAAALADPALGPLSATWSSHRDLLGFRRAPFFDAQALRARVDAERVHADCGGRPLVSLAAEPRATGPAPSLPFLLRVAGAVLGVLPSDRRCFRAFVHAARRLGVPSAELADALALTTRRVRQLASEPAPEEALVHRTLQDPALSRVP